MKKMKSRLITISAACVALFVTVSIGLAQDPAAKNDDRPNRWQQKRGNPVEIAAVVIWRVRDTAQAMFDVDNYEKYVPTQSESALRHLATRPRIGFPTRLPHSGSAVSRSGRN